MRTRSQTTERHESRSPVPGPGMPLERPREKTVTPSTQSSVLPGWDKGIKDLTEILEKDMEYSGTVFKVRGEQYRDFGSLVLALGRKDVQEDPEILKILRFIFENALNRNDTFQKVLVRLHEMARNAPGFAEFESSDEYQLEWVEVLNACKKYIQTRNYRKENERRAISGRESLVECWPRLGPCLVEFAATSQSRGRLVSAFRAKVRHNEQVVIKRLNRAIMNRLTTFSSRHGYRKLLVNPQNSDLDDAKALPSDFSPVTQEEANEFGVTLNKDGILEYNQTSIPMTYASTPPPSCAVTPQGTNDGLAVGGAQIAPTPYTPTALSASSDGVDQIGGCADFALEQSILSEPSNNTELSLQDKQATESVAYSDMPASDVVQEDSNTPDTPGGLSSNTPDTPGASSSNTIDTPGSSSSNTPDTPGGSSSNTLDTLGGPFSNTPDTPGGPAATNWHRRRIAEVEESQRSSPASDGRSMSIHHQEIAAFKRPKVSTLIPATVDTPVSRHRTRTQTIDVEHSDQNPPGICIASGTVPPTNSVRANGGTTVESVSEAPSRRSQANDLNNLALPDRGASAAAPDRHLTGSPDLRAPGPSSGHASGLSCAITPFALGNNTNRSSSTPSCSEMLTNAAAQVFADMGARGHYKSKPRHYKYEPHDIHFSEKEVDWDGLIDELNPSNSDVRAELSEHGFIDFEGMVADLLNAGGTNLASEALREAELVKDHILDNGPQLYAMHSLVIQQILMADPKIYAMNVCLRPDHKYRLRAYHQPAIYTSSSSSEPDVSEEYSSQVQYCHIDKFKDSLTCFIPLLDEDDDCCDWILDGVGIGDPSIQYSREYRNYLAIFQAEDPPVDQTCHRRIDVTGFIESMGARGRYKERPCPLNVGTVRFMSPNVPRAHRGFGNRLVVQSTLVAINERTGEVENEVAAESLAEMHRSHEPCKQGPWGDFNTRRSVGKWEGWTTIRGVSPISDAIYGYASWEDDEVIAQLKILFGKDPEARQQLITQTRQVAAHKAIAAITSFCHKEQLLFPGKHPRVDSQPAPVEAAEQDLPTPPAEPVSGQRPSRAKRTARGTANGNPVASASAPAKRRRRRW
ncbi:uncharacterized protein DSM5745_06574 [Aspergillus mulundensis]|uniref:Uncharacterized protein n=1 Tax=Aspergillus mulundensis TaxID=1810919 RepID=A0A3D8RR70_9EURO|nr:hypothetical protein DSM5745_06574 [Aspergillus mulundensis]RDW76582.1 hypothetical protein DSM5745_06574 [Aspergillus mulundensis]